MGRSRGGLTTKIHALVDVGRSARSLLKLSEGQAHDGRSCRRHYDSCCAGQTLLADRAYDSDALRSVTRGSRRAGRTSASCRTGSICPDFDAGLYRKRNHVERSFNKLKHFRAIATRYDKRDDNFLASI